MTHKQLRAQYTQEFKMEAVRQVRAGQAIAVVAKVLGSLCLAVYEWVHPGSLTPSGRTEALFRWAKEAFGTNGVAWLHIALAGIASLFALAIYLAPERASNGS